MIRRLVLNVSLGYMLAIPSVFAGPLDRGPMQQRYNPAAESMLRVPGVVGMYEQEALFMLQQSGLAVSIKRITRDDPKYRGKEGQVVRQDPATGGVAMIGSTVAITVYKRGDAYQDGGYDDQWGGGVDTGWTPPPPDEESDEAHGEPVLEGPEFEGDLGRDVSNVPGPVKGFPGKGAPAAGAGGGVVGIPQGRVAPGGVAPVSKPSGPAEGGKRPLMTPEQARDLKGRADQVRKEGVRGGKSASPGKGTAVARPVGAVRESSEKKGTPAGIVAKPVPVTGTASSGGTSVGAGVGTVQAVPVKPAATMQGRRAAAPTPGVPDNGSCRSWASIAGDIYMKTKEELRNFSPLTVKSIDEREVGPLTKWTCQFWASLGDSSVPRRLRMCLETMSPSFVLTMNQVLLNYWNQQAENDWATIGPRRLMTDETHKGRLVSATGRLFVTPTILYTDSVTLELKKVGGRARTEVAACVYEPEGDRFIAWDFTIPKGKGNKGYQWTKTLNGVGGKILSVHLKSRSASHSLRYELRAVNNEN